MFLSPAPSLQIIDLQPCGRLCDCCHTPIFISLKVHFNPCNTISTIGAEVYGVSLS